MAPSSFRIALISLFVQLPLIASAAAVALPNHGGGVTVTYPVYKDATGTQLYYTTLQIGTPPTTANFTLTLASQLLWYVCQIDGFKSTTYRPVPCQSRMCLEAKGAAIGCRSCEEPSPRPGCTNDTCAAMAFNPFDGVRTAEPLYTDVLQVPSRSSAVQNFPFQCAGYAMYYLSGLPKLNKGMLGLALSNVSLPAAVSSGLKLPNIFALCLPSDKGAGKLLVGGGPYNTPGIGKLMQTPIIINPYSTAPVHGSREESYEYFIRVTYIKVAGVPVKLNSTLLSFHDYGYGGTKLSSLTPYTILQRAIYEPLVDEFTKAATGMKMQRVPAVGNLSVCFSSASIARDGNEPAVPAIDLVLQYDDVYLRMEGSNLMVKVTETVSCMGVVDGGDEPRTAVVIGGRQMEDRLVEFDLASMQLRFSSSSLRKQKTTCSRSF